jgi:hypothetical protein
MTPLCSEARIHGRLGWKDRPFTLLSWEQRGRGLKVLTFPIQEHALGKQSSVFMKDH